MRNLESKLQIECVKWFRLQYPKLLLFSIPNGGKRNAITASILKAEGVVSGVPDLFLATQSDGCGCVGLFIEMKYGKNKLSANQSDIMNRLEKEGYKCEICYSFDSFRQVVENYLHS